MVNISNTTTTMPTWLRISGDVSGFSLVSDAPNPGIVPYIPKPLGLREAIRFSGDLYVVIRVFLRGVFLRRLAISLRGSFDELKFPRTRDDDAHRRRHRYSLLLQRRRGVRAEGENVLLGVGQP